MLRRRTAPRRSPVANDRQPRLASAARNALAARRSSALCEALEVRTLLSSSFDITSLTAMRNDPNFSFLTGQGIGIAGIRLDPRFESL